MVPSAVSAMKEDAPTPRESRVTSTPQRIGTAANAAKASMKATISADVANASGAFCGNGKSGNRTDQFGNWNFSPSPAFAAPAFGDPRPLQHQMRDAALFEVVAHRESGLAAA